MTPAEFHERWDDLAALTAQQHPDATLEDWLLYHARGVLIECDATPPTRTGRVGRMKTRRRRVTSHPEALGCATGSPTARPGTEPPGRAAPTP